MAIVGKPNVGKSTLINRLVGSRIAITSNKPQTTRNRIMGVITHPFIQYVFLDTPGWHIPNTKLGEYMQRTAEEAVEGIDLIYFVTYPKESLDNIEINLIEELNRRKIPVLLVMNKSDTLSSKLKGERQLEALKEQGNFSNAVAVSALNGDGIEELMNLTSSYATLSEFMYDEDTLTDQTERFIVSELVRERLIKNLSNELPYGVAVTVESFKERENSNIIDIDVTILCEKQSHKGMIIGKNGLMLKKIASEARKEIEDFLDSRVNLKCWVKVRDGWRDKDNYIKDFSSIY